MGGDGLIGAVAGELRHTDGVLAVLPGGRGNDFARKLGIGADPVAACDVLAEGREQRIDVADIDGRAYLGIASSGLDSDAGDLANATRLQARPARLRLRDAARASRAWRPARWEVVIDGAARSFTGYSVAVANSGVFGGGMYLAPDAKLDDGLLDVVMIGDMPKRTLPARRCRRSSPARTSASRASRSCQAREVAFHADRPFNVQADGDPIADLPATVRVQPGALRVMAPDEPARPQGGRRQGRRRARAPRRARRRHLAARQGAHAPGAARDRPARRAPRARQRRDLGHQRQDDDGGDGGRRSSSAPARRLVHNRAGANMAGGVASALAAASRRGGRELDGDLGLFEVDEFWLGDGGRGAAARARCCSRTCSATSSTATASSTRSPTAGPVVAERRRRARSSCSTPTTRSSPTSAARTRGAVLRRRGRRASPTPSSSTPRTPSTAAAAGTPTSTRPPTSATSAATTARTAATAAPSRPWPPSRSQLRGIRSAAFTLRTPQGSTRVELPLPGLYNVYNALGAAALCLSLGVELPTIAAGLGAVEPAFGRAETIDLDGRADLDPAGQEPGGRQRGPAHARARGRRARPLRRPQRPHRRRPRRLVGVGRRLGDCSSPHVARMTCSGTRAAELALRMKYAGVPTRAPARRRGARRRASTPRWRAAAARSTRSPPTPRCSSCASCCPTAAQAQGVLAVSAHVVWHDVECGALRRPTCRCGASWPTPRPARCSTSAPAPAAWRSSSPRAGHDVTALDLDPELLAELRARAPRAPASRSAPRSRRRRRLRAAPAPPFGLIARADADDPAAARPRRARRLPRLRARAPRARRPAWRSRVAEELEPFEADPPLPLPPDLGERDGWRYRLLPGRDPRRAATASCSSACARRSRPTAAHDDRGRRDRARHAQRPATSRPRAAAAGLRPEAAAPHRRDRRPRRLRRW